MRTYLRDLSPYMVEAPTGIDYDDIWMGSKRIPRESAYEIIQTIIARTICAEAQNHRCAYCTVRTDAFGPERRRPTLEHVVPKMRGGKRDHPLNHLMVCNRCNCKRGEQYLTIERMVPEEARVSPEELVAYRKARRQQRGGTVGSPLSSKRRQARRRLERYGLHWRNDCLVFFSGEAVGSVYQIGHYTPYQIKLAAPGLATAQETVFQGSRADCMRTLARIGIREVLERTRAKLVYQRELSAIFSSASTILNTSAA